MRTVTILCGMIMILSALPALAAPNYHRPIKKICLVRYSCIESSYLNRLTAWGKPLSLRYAASDDLPFGTKIFIPYYVQNRHGKYVKKTICRVVADRPRHKTSGKIMVEPYIPKRHEYFLRHVLQGNILVTIIRPRS